MGKGSHRRPSFVSEEEYARNYLRIFGKRCPNPYCFDGTHCAPDVDLKIICPICKGVGYIEKKKKTT